MLILAFIGFAAYGGCQSNIGSNEPASLLITITWDTGTYDQLHFSGLAGTVNMFPAGQDVEPTPPTPLTSGVTVRIFLPERAIGTVADATVDGFAGGTLKGRGRTVSAPIAIGDNSMNVKLLPVVVDGGTDGGPEDAGGVDGGSPDAGSYADGGSTCSGCSGCCSLGTCVTSSNTQCGIGGAACVNCTQLGEVCDVNGTCVAHVDAGCTGSGCMCSSATNCPMYMACDQTTHFCSTQCSSTSPCNQGCCDTTKASPTCTQGVSINACGSGGLTCSNCAMIACVSGCSECIAGIGGGGCMCVPSPPDGGPCP